MNWTINSITAPISTVGTVETDENISVVPITVKNFNNVTGCDLELTYDPAIVTCTHVTTDLPYMFFIGTPKDGGKIGISWIYFQAGDFDGISRPDDTVAFELHFSKINGVTGISPVEFDISNPMYNMWIAGKANEEFNDVPEENFYFSGSITQLGSSASEVPESVDILAQQLTHLLL